MVTAVTQYVCVRARVFYLNCKSGSATKFDT